jgi:hypothetical protein
MIVTSQATVGGTAVPLVTVPPGPSAVTITNGGTAALYVGAGTTVTSANGAPIPAGAAVTLGGHTASSASKLWGITAGGTVAPIVTAGLFISNGS